MRVEHIGDAMLYLGDCTEAMQSMAAESVQCVVTSPPYWGLRDYGVDGQIGLEDTPEEYVQKMVDVFREVRRVLRGDGTVWLNMGDCYAGSGKAGNNPEYWGKHKEFGHLTGSNPGRFGRARVIPPPGLKPKDLVGIPWRAALALQADGWYLRQDIIWSKPNPMPESVTDRCTKAHEYIFLLSKSARYFYNADAIKEPATNTTTKMPDGWDTGSGSHGSFHRNGREKGKKTRGQEREHEGFRDKWDGMTKQEQGSFGRNKRSVWTVSTSRYSAAHFATFPPKLIEPCILAGSRPGDTVLDPFGGSGTTAGVAMQHGRKAILCELSEEYGALVPARIESITDAYRQPRLFKDEPRRPEQQELDMGALP